MEDRESAPVRPAGPEFHRLFVRCTGGLAAIPLGRIDEVLVAQQLTRVPGAGPEVCGLIGLRGRVLTVFDLCGLLGGRGLDLTGDYRILVARAAGRVVGLAVADVATSAGAEAGEAVPADLDLDLLIGSRLG